MPINLIVATDLNNGIGYQNKLLCHLPADLAYFKKTTLGFPVVMGRKTFESIGRILPGRQNIIISASGFTIPGALSLKSIEAFKTMYIKDQTYFIIGGSSIYEQTLSWADCVYRTLIQHRFQADVFFPNLSTNGFTLTDETLGTQDQKNSYKHSFQIWKPSMHV
ncbi:MAG: dihydrofolate reductase [Sphingobacteriia bacterium]|nr:dihydrofolate reductase [Sphingobacteriia bacterium]